MPQNQGLARCRPGDSARSQTKDIHDPIARLQIPAGGQRALCQLNANNPDTPAQVGSWGAEKVNVMWNWGHNAPTPELEKIYVAYKKKFDGEFTFAEPVVMRHSSGR